MTVSLFVSASDILLSMLFNLLLASITILLCSFFLFLIVFKNFFTNFDVIENVKPQLAPIIPGEAPITAANYAIEMLLDNIDKTFNDLSKMSKEAIYLLTFLLISSLSLISAKK